jgi:transposase
MIIIGCDFHTRYQQIAMLDEGTGELTERRLEHENGEANTFYRSLAKPVRVGIEATGPIHWFERLLAELDHELWIGDSARIRAREVRKQKTDERDAALILELLLTNRFPRIWVPTPAERDLRQLLWHGHKLVCLRTMLGNQWHFLALSQGLCRKRKLFTKNGRSELGSLTLEPWTSRRREELLRLLDGLDPAIAELHRAVLQAARQREDAVLLLTHPGVGPNTALAFLLAVGPVSRFACSKKIASYFGWNPSEESSGGRRRLGAISKQGNRMVRWLLVETVHHAVRQDAELRQDYQRLKFRRGHAVAKVAIARKLAVRMYWMLRSGTAYAQLVRRQGSPGPTLMEETPSRKGLGALLPRVIAASEERIMVGTAVTE